MGNLLLAVARRLHFLVPLFLGANAFGQIDPQSTAEPVAWRQMLDDRKHAELELHVIQALERGQADLSAYRALYRGLERLVNAKPASISPFDEWVATTGS